MIKPSFNSGYISLNIKKQLIIENWTMAPERNKFPIGFKLINLCSGE
jgi:hypothetical protein